MKTIWKDKAEILEQIKITKEQKAKALSEQCFEMASMLRDKEKMLSAKLEELERRTETQQATLGFVQVGQTE